MGTSSSDMTTTKQTPFEVSREARDAFSVCGLSRLMRARYRLKWCLLLLAFTVQGAESRVPVRLDGLFEVFLLFLGKAFLDILSRTHRYSGFLNNLRYIFFSMECIFPEKSISKFL